ncbi:MAG: CAP domain-containing protein [Actinomycetota bacterium]|nr:CAP domain-containing protein [Actinomycetota bacterium]
MKLRLVLVAVALIVTLGACDVQPAPPNGGLRPDQIAAGNAINADRRAAGLSVLFDIADLQAKAQAWADQVAADGYLHHSNLWDGITTRACALGENIAVSSSVAGNEAELMADPPHRANVLGNWDLVGVGVAYRDGSVVTVQDFMLTC